MKKTFRESHSFLDEGMTSASFFWVRLRRVGWASVCLWNEGLITEVQCKLVICRGLRENSYMVTAGGQFPLHFNFFIKAGHFLVDRETVCCCFCSVAVSVDIHTEVILGNKILLPSMISGRSCYSQRSF